MKSSAARLAFLVATPPVLAVVLWFHPKAHGDTLYEALRNDVTAMLVVHVTMLFFIPLMALAAFVLLNGLQTRAATVSRWSLGAFVALHRLGGECRSRHGLPDRLRERSRRARPGRHRGRDRAPERQLRHRRCIDHPDHRHGLDRGNGSRRYRTAQRRRHSARRRPDRMRQPVRASSATPRADRAHLLRRRRRAVSSARARARPPHTRCFTRVDRMTMGDPRTVQRRRR
jgi:hypothetical protein